VTDHQSSNAPFQSILEDVRLMDHLTPCYVEPPNEHRLQPSQNKYSQAFVFMPCQKTPMLRSSPLQGLKTATIIKVQIRESHQTPY
jgi:hypothetical protein